MAALEEGAGKLLAGAPRARVWLRDDDGQVVPAAEGGDEAAGALALEALTGGRTAERVAAERSGLAVPLAVKDRPEGAIVVEAEGHRRFSSAEREALQVLANQAAAALENERLYRRAEQEAIRDGLTGLYNHRHFQERLRQECRRAHRYGTPLSLLMLDLDDFKSFNDQFGHQIGDEALREVGQILFAVTRRGVDLAARYGGEEFAVILPHTRVSDVPSEGAAGRRPTATSRRRRPAPGRWSSPSASARRSPGTRSPGTAGAATRGPPSRSASPSCARTRSRPRSSRPPTRPSTRASAPAATGWSRVADERPAVDGPGAVNERRDGADVFTLASDVSQAIAASPDLDEMLSVIARRVAEALDVWECNIYEYRPETDSLVATALWASEITEDDRAWLGSVYPMADRPSYQHLLAERSVRERQADDPGCRPPTGRSWSAGASAASSPCRSLFQDEVIGALTLVEKRAPRRFTPDDLRLLELMAVPAAVAVHTARMFRREAEQTRRLGALLSASRAMTATIDLDQLLATITHEARVALDTAECAIDTYDPDAETMTVVAFEQRTPEPDWERWVGRVYSLDEYAFDRRLLYGGEIVEERVSDPSMDEQNRADMLENGEKSLLNVPLVYEGRPIGLLVFIETEVERHFTDEERQLAAALGEQAAAAIHHAQLLRQTEAQNRQLGLLLESTRAISSSVDLDEVLNTVARTAAELLGSQECQIQEYDPAANTVTPVALWQRVPYEGARDSIGQVFSLEEDPEERAFLEAGEVLEQRYSDPDLPASTRQSFEKYGTAPT